MILKSKAGLRRMVWGNRETSRWFGVNSPPYVGEVWLLSGHEMCETKLVDSDGNEFRPKQFISDFVGTECHRFPLLVKFISSSQWLSVQVHPDDVLARTLESEPWGKSECWYALQDSTVALVESAMQVKEAIKTGRWRSVLEVKRIPKGSVLYIPAGLVHALGPNSQLIEIQQSSNLTYRLYDWDRHRELHLRKAEMAVKSHRWQQLFKSSLNIFECPYFVLKRDSNSVAKGPVIVVMLSDGRVEGRESKKYETFLISRCVSAHIHGEFLSISPGSAWSNLCRK